MNAEEEQGALGSLDNLVLGTILSDLGVSSQEAIASAQLLTAQNGSTKIPISTSAADTNRNAGGDENSGGARMQLATDQIYGEKYMDDDFGTRDDDGEESDGMAEDLEAENDRKAREERLYRAGLESVQATSSRQIRGEVGYDDDDEDEEGEDASKAERERQREAEMRALLRIKREPGTTPEAELVDDDADGDADAEGEEEDEVTTPPPAATTTQAAGAEDGEMSLPHRPKVNIKAVFPDYAASSIINFTELYSDLARPLKKARTAALTPEPAVGSGADSATRATATQATHISPSPPTIELPSTRDEAEAPSLAGPAQKASVVQWALEPLVRAVRLDWRTHDEDAAASLDPMDIEDWESNIILHSSSVPAAALRVRPDRLFNHDLADGSWENGIVLDGKGPSKRDYYRLLLDMNDPEMMLERSQTDTVEGTDQAQIASAARPSVTTGGAVVAQKHGVDFLNLSNDHFYEVSKEQMRRRVRQTLGQLIVQHAPPANALQLPFYKTRLTKTEARSFHRPAMQFPSNIPLKFAKARSSKKKKEEREGATGKSGKNKDPAELLKSSRDLSLRDTSQFVMYEYSEEYPPLLSKMGMGSLIVNYYRKRNERDEHVPKSDLGEPFILDLPDESPFMKFGSVHPGQTQPTLYNNLVRAPLFRHKPASTDFLLVRSTNRNSVRYFLREIKNVFVVGQTYPLVQIPGPHARLVTNAIKTRLQMIAYKLVATTPLNRIKIHRIMRYFPDQNELQMRQRLKEFMAYNRTAGHKDQGYWKLKPGIVAPEESELQKQLPPEHMALIEAMQTGQRHLLDAGYTQSAEGADEDGDESKMDIEQLLAPWIVSKNFLHATQGKAMLKLHGEGDPSGRGEAFSFLRVSMKEVFFRAGDTLEAQLAAQAEEERKSGHKYNVQKQQQVYKSEIERIWQAQAKALSNPVPPKLTAQDLRENLERDEAENARNQQNAPRASATEADESESQAGLDTRVLRIRRLVRGRWETEIVRDSGVIGAYLRQRQRIEDEATATESLVPTGDAALDAARRKRLEAEVAQLKKNQDRRLQRKNAKAAAEGLAIPGGFQKLLNKTDTKRRCGRCGQVGHMSTNTSCPLYEAPKPSQMASSASSRAAVKSGGGGSEEVNAAGSTDASRRPTLMNTGMSSSASMYGVPQTPSSAMPPPASPFPFARTVSGTPVPSPATPGFGMPSASAASPGTPAPGSATPVGGTSAPRFKLKLGKKKE